MKITMNMADLKTIFNACGKFVSKDDLKPILKTVQLNFFNGMCTAYALDGIKMMTVAVPYTDGDEGTMNVPIIKLPKGAFVNITSEGNEVTFDFLDHKQTLKNYDGEFPKNPEQFFKQETPTLRIGFDPRNLRDALDGFKDDRVVALNFVDKNKACIIEGTNRKALVFPYRIE